MYCLDTNIVIDFLRGNKEIIEKVRVLREEGGIFLTSITLCELYKGVFLSSKSEQEFILVENFIESNEILDLDRGSSKEFGKGFASLQRAGKTTDELDLMIASIVKANNFILITRDKKHFENTGVKLRVW